jgi:ribosomal protein S18 acetylase RimI-like enzyme
MMLKHVMPSWRRCLTTSETRKGDENAPRRFGHNGGSSPRTGGEVVGFLTLEPRFDECLEVTWMAVRADRRRQGIGRALLDRVASDSREEGRKFLLVLTVSPSDGADEIPDGYQATRASYAANGFILARDFPGYWKSDTPILMVRPLNDLKE